MLPFPKKLPLSLILLFTINLLSPLLLPIAARAQSQGDVFISPQSKISLITCAPGSALFEAFGHSAIRVHDPVTGFDMAYNYGVFDFDQPNFYVNFAKGYLLYKLGTAEFNRFLYQYSYFDRTVKEQVLNLTYEQKSRVFNFLRINSLPENQNYYYDYFFDNCATRPRDVLMEVLGDTLQFDYSYADTLDYSIRDLIDIYIEDKDQHAWGDLGIDLGLGAKIDRKATPFEYMYQPEYLFKAFASARLQNADGSDRPLVALTNTLYEGRSSTPNLETLLTPATVFWVLFALVVLGTFYEYKVKKHKFYLFDLVFFLLLSLYGCLVIFLWFFTNHISAANNWNLLWGFPTHFIALFFLLIDKFKVMLKYHFMVTALLAAFALCFWTVLPQELHYSIMPLLLIIIIRSIVIIQFKLSGEGAFLRKAQGRV
ncbi:DUF4105 domain-containing protein [Porifericola rhodea]|uniref:lipoprotein N-acyltransferase Lnb domain-containing protein n=1 Tax=Porifericola rhodea TaxID=930972 RepID=UPI00266523F1|nr:DUF4105 domain-containing protein [Porifericola rhodea]WKN30969.1 DUF4105 domain-containing protein [Porifericola rhodea]